MYSTVTGDEVRLDPTEEGREEVHDSQMRVALFTGAYNHIADGVSLTLNRLVEFLERHGVNVMVFAPTVDDPPIQHHGTLAAVSSISVPRRPEYRFSLGLSRSARQKLASFEPTILHIATPDLLGRAALAYGRKHDIPIVSSYHTHFSSYLKYYHLTAFEGTLWSYLRWFYGHCEHIYVPSPSMADVLRNHGISDRLLYWPRGVDTSRFNPAMRSLDWRKQLGVNDDEVVVSLVSRLVWEKGLSVFVDVVQRLEQMGVAHRTMVVGDGPARTDLEQQLPNAIFTGYLADESLARAYASSDVFLFPSQTETFGNVTLEAMASGVPTVCADATGSNALVESGVTGYLAPPTDVDTFFESVHRLIVDPKLRSTMSHAAAERARQYAWDSVLNRMLCYYRDIQKGSRATRPAHRKSVAVRPRVGSPA
ncbi:MAG: glycosyltransferase family 1 protein [Bacteroidetes bacterium]|nr:glycosyltransferase family 1 protein [Bacteroidota bacterium]